MFLRIGLSLAWDSPRLGWLAIKAQRSTHLYFLSITHDFHMGCRESISGPQSWPAEAISPGLFWDYKWNTSCWFSWAKQEYVVSVFSHAPVGCMNKGGSTGGESHRLHQHQEDQSGMLPTWHTLSAASWLMNTLNANQGPGLPQLQQKWQITDHDQTWVAYNPLWMESWLWAPEAKSIYIIKTFRNSQLSTRKWKLQEENPALTFVKYSINAGRIGGSMGKDDKPGV